MNRTQGAMVREVETLINFEKSGALLPFFGRNGDL